MSADVGQPPLLRPCEYAEGIKVVEHVRPDAFHDEEVTSGKRVVCTFDKTEKDPETARQCPLSVGPKK